MAKRHSPKNSYRGPSQPRTSANENIPKENRILCQHYMKALYHLSIDDKILNMLFLGKIKYQSTKEKAEGIVKRMTDCWLNTQAQYGPRVYLEELMKRYQIQYEKDPRWAKYKILGAPLIIDPRILVTRSGKWINFLNLFQKNDLRTNQKQSECEVRLQQNNTQILFKNLQQILQCQLTIHPSSSFPAKQPVILNPKDHYSDANNYHVILDTKNILHLVELSKAQDLVLPCYYRDKDPHINVVQSNWDQYISNVRGSQAMDIDSSSSSSNNEIIERLDELQIQQDQLNQSEVQIINRQNSPAKRVKQDQIGPQRQYLVEQLSFNEIKTIISEERISQTNSQLTLNSQQVQQSRSQIETFILYWDTIRRKTQFNLEIDKQDFGRDINEPFYKIGAKDLLNLYIDKDTPTQMQTLYTYLNYQREQIFHQEIGQKRRDYFRNRTNYMDNKFRAWLRSDAQVNKKKLQKLYDVINWEDSELIQYEALVQKTKIENLFMAGSQFIGYQNYPDSGSRIFLVLVTRQLEDSIWVCEIDTKETQSLFVKQFCQYILPKSYNLQYLAPNWSVGLAV